MKGLFITALLLSSLVYGQDLYIEDHTESDVFDHPSTFPIFKAKESGNGFAERAAEKINIYLQKTLLDKIYPNDQEHLFSEVFPTKDFIGGQSEFSYEIERFDDKFISLSIEYNGTGAYSEYYHSYFTFVEATGEHVSLEDIYYSGSLLQFGEIVSQRCVQEIDEFLEGIDPSDEYAADQMDMYADCKEWLNGDGMPTSRFYLTDSTIVFVVGRCSNHAMAALDDVWEFYIDMAFEGMETYFRDGFKSVLEGKRDHKSISGGLPEDKVLKGFVDGRIPITGIITGLSGSFIHGVYWYDKYKKPITLRGEPAGDNKWRLIEEMGSKKIANVELIFQNGQLQGVWEKADGSNSFPIVFLAE